MKNDDKSFEKFKEKYQARIKSEFDGRTDNLRPINSREYSDFKKEYLPKHLTIYEKLCNFSEKVVQIKPDKKKIPELQEAIDICHLNITPTGTTSFAIVIPLFIIIIGLIFGYLLPFLISGEAGLFFLSISVIIGLSLMVPLGKIPFLFSNNWRMKSSNQMVLCIFYVVTHMRHTSNLELAIDFAAEHLTPPLSIDLKKVVWDIETQKFSSIKESLDTYLESWRKWNQEFIESMHLIESSLYENSEDRRVNALDKSLSVMLEETYERMLHFSQNLKSPITTLHMMGIVLPILGLVILPLVVSFMSNVKWYHLFTLYNVILPGAVYYMSRIILSKRPTGYGDSDISQKFYGLQKYKKILIKIGSSEIRISPAILCFLIFGVLFFIGISPLLIHQMLPNFDCSIGSRGLSCLPMRSHPDAKYYFLGYRDEIIDGYSTGKIVGPFGLGATLLSTGIPLSFGIAIGLFYKIRSKKLIKIREQTKKLEGEFASALFQLGNRLGDGLPAEIAFSKVAKMMEGTHSGRFFEDVSMNIQKLGMSVKQAIFDEKSGAINNYPSPIIESSMKVLIESSKKGPIIASQALINVSSYIKDMHRVDERLKDLMADDISSMKAQVAFLTPAITGIVIGITSMITTILGTLTEKITLLTTQAQDGSANMSSIMGMFGTGVPTYFFQIIVGLYVVQIVYILTILINGIENGADKLSERYMVGNNLFKTTITYSVIAFIIILIFNMIAGSILTSVSISVT
ncbi:MAG: hypothetical protein KKB65_04185 [Nanoarchaeota archaeon]|nr:hypothetical protein [Nanoarchaeota archaeon]MBU1850028.1 hypothetical protein [Nanoarchaeota archaeon]